MPHPFAIATEAIQKLDDEQLRTLLVKLCEADLLEAHLPLSGLTAGGHQNAPDGGVDVRVEAIGQGTSFLPAFPVGLQCKVEPMQPGKVTKEMRPNGVIRDVLVDLAHRGGSYILASGRDDCTDRKHRSLLSAMAKALEGVSGSDRLQLRFYDASQLARWTNRHEGVAMWVAGLLDLPLQGWRPFESWSTANEPPDAPYFSDSTMRVLVEGHDAPLTVEHALTQIRAALAHPRSIVRLVGLSGMGKTRMAQALFDPRIGEGSLSESMAVYGDAGLPHLHAPELMAAHLIQQRKKALLIVDNCRSDMHRRLVEKVRRPDSLLSLLTIDFDVGEDQPAHTSTVRLEPADDDVIDLLIKQRAPHIRSRDRRRITVFSGGNARIALALALNADGQSLVQLSDADLFARLFLDARRNPDDSLRRVARSAALVYAFDVEHGAESREVQALAALANVDIDTFFEKLGELLERGLAQQRGNQRAILPQALAARLAGEALRLLTPGKIERVLTEEAPKRLQMSFTRRLGLLHEAPRAVEIARQLLERGLPFSNWSTHDRWRAFTNLAPLALQRSLEIVCETLTRANPNEFDFRWSAWDRSGSLLIALAYHREHFSAATGALIDLMTRLGIEKQDNQIRNSFTSLFEPFRARTQAAAVQRFSLLQGLLASTEPSHQQLGFESLLCTLAVRSHRHVTIPDFGSRPQDQGWRPDNTEEIEYWFDQALTIAERFLCSDAAKHEHRNQIGRCLEGLLDFEPTRSRTVIAIRTIGRQRYWAQAWFAACRLIHRHVRLEKPALSSLAEIESELRPKTPDDQLEAWVLGDPNDWQQPTAPADDIGSSEDFIEQTRQLGVDVGTDAPTRQRLVARALREPHAIGFCFGQGLAQTAPDLEEGWRELRTLLQSVAGVEPNITPLKGYLHGARQRDPALVAAWLSAAVADALLKPWIVGLYFAADLLGETAARHMLAVLKEGVASPYGFAVLRFGRASHELPNRLLSRIVMHLCATPDGLKVAAEVLHMRYHGESEAPLDNSLIRAGRFVLRAYLSSELSDHDRVHPIESIANRCLTGPGGKTTALIAAASLRQSISNLNAQEMARCILLAVFRHHPLLSLDGFFGSSPVLSNYSRSIVDPDEIGQVGAQILDSVEAEALHRWIAVTPNERAPVIARYVAMSAIKDGHAHWTPTALWLLSPGIVSDAVITAFDHRFFAGSWSGSSETRYRQLRELAAHLVKHEDPRVSAWANELVQQADDQWARRGQIRREEMAAFE